MCKPVSVLASSSPFLLPSKPSLQKAVLNTTCLRPAGVMGVEMLGWGLLALKAWFQLCSWFSTMPNYAGSWTDCSVLHLTLTVHMKYLDCIGKPFLRHTAAMATAFVGSRCSTLSHKPGSFHSTLCWWYPRKYWSHNKCTRQPAACHQHCCFTGHIVPKQRPQKQVKQPRLPHTGVTSEELYSVFSTCKRH